MSNNGSCQGLELRRELNAIRDNLRDERSTEIGKAVNPILSRLDSLERRMTDQGKRLGDVDKRLDKIDKTLILVLKKLS